MSPRRIGQAHPLPALLMLVTAPLAYGQARSVERVAAPGLPRVRIHAPLAHSVHDEGADVPLVATAFDPEDGDLGAALRWSSSLDGALGVGGSLHARLRPGAHTIRATVHDRRGNVACASTVVVVQGVAPQASGLRHDDPAPAHGFEIVAANRYTAMAPLEPSQQFVALDHEDARLAYRFTNEVERDVDVVMLVYRSVGSPADLRVSIVDDDGSLLPAPGPGPASVVFAPHAPSPVARWHRLELPPAGVKHLHAGRTYHVVVEAADPEPDALSPTDHVELVVARARHPVAFLPNGAQTLDTLESPLNASLAVLIDDGGPQGFLVHRDNFASYAPVFLLQDTIGEWFGQPYDQHHEFRVAGDVLFGEALTLAAPIRFDYVSMYVRAAGVSSGPVPTDDLWVRIFADRGGDVYEPIGSPRVLMDRHGFLHHGRSHWFGARLDEPVELGPGRYVLALHSPGSAPQSTNDGYVFSLENSSAPLHPRRVPSYRVDRSVVVRSRDGGETFEAVRDRGDAAFVLGSVAGHGDPRAVHDETAGATDYPRSACPGSLLRFRVLTRNVGRRSEAGELFARLVDTETEEVVARTIYPGLGSNEEIAENLQLGMPDRDLLLRLECGHTEGARQVVDDTYELEVRRTTNCP